MQLMSQDMDIIGISLEYLLSERTSRVSPVSFSSARSSRIDNGLLYIYPRDATSQIFTQFIGAIDVACVTLCHNINIINVRDHIERIIRCSNSFRIIVTK